MSWLAAEGAKAVRKEAQRYLRGLTNEVKSHITSEVERVMSEIDRLNAAVEQELADDAAQNELIAELRRQLGIAQEAAEAAVAGEAEAQRQLTEALAAADSAAERLESNDPVVEEPEQPEEPPVDPVEPGEPDPEA